MTDAIFSLAQTGGTWDADIGDVLIARRINQVCGGAVIAPWEVGQLDDTTIDLYTAMSTDLPQMQSVLKRSADKMAAWRAKHPTYRK